MRTTLVLALVCALVPASAAAQPTRPRTGFELALHGSARAFVGRPLRLRGTAFEVRGLATLVALPNATVRARYRTEAADLAPSPWVDVRATRDGRFTVEVPIPAGAHGASRIDVSVGDGTDQREIEGPTLELVSPLALDLLTDRQLYEAGERIRVWSRVRDVASQAPVAGAHVSFEIEGLGEREVVTGASGVASLEMAVPESEREGNRLVRARAGAGLARVEQSAMVRIGRRNVDRLLVDLEISPETPAPEAPFEIIVHARTASGAAVRHALVVAEVSGVGRMDDATTDDAGIAHLRGRAPAFLPDESGWVGVDVTVTHSAHGARTAQTGFVLAQARALAIGAVVPGRVLVPEVDGELYVSLLEPSGDPPPAGAAITVSGSAVRGGTFRGVTDRHGLVAVPTRLPRGAAALHGESGECGNAIATSIDVTVAGEVTRTARVCVRVDPEALVSVRASPPVVAPGDRLDVSVARRPGARTRDVAVDLVAFVNGREERLASKVLSPSETRTTFVIPAGRVGVLRVHARPSGAPEASDGIGASDAVLVRPTRPVFPELVADRPVYPVRGTARVTVRTGAGSAGWVAVLARDLSAHGGEHVFERRFLDGAFERAVVDPATLDAERLVRAALAAGLEAEEEPARAAPLVDALGAPAEESNSTPIAARGDLRDPLPAAHELERRGVAEMMRAVEGALASALESGDTEGVVVVTGGRRRFEEDLPSTALGDEARTLGGGAVTVSMLTAADPSFTFDSVARRIARKRLVSLLVALGRYLDPSDADGETARSLPSEPPERWLSRMTQLGLIEDASLLDPWGGHFVVTRSRRPGGLSLAVASYGLELVSPGPDRRLGTADDVRDPFERAVPRGTPWAVASGEDELMSALSLIAPGPEVLTAIAAAYTRMTDAAIEEQRGDAAGAGVSEFYGTGRGGGGTGEGTIGLGSIGTIGHGSGSGSGSGYGRGAGGFGSRSAHVPQIRAGSAVVQGGGRGLMSALLRRRFPATLAFVPDRALDASGETVVELPLADAVTTYRVEAIVWGPDGWTWPATVDIRVDQETVIDAPVPPYATVGDRIRMPVRIGNRTDAPIRVRARVSASTVLGGDTTESELVDVPAHDAARVVVSLALGRAGEGAITLAAQTADGRVLDGIERPIVVLDDSRRVRDDAETIVDGSGELELTVPDGALVRGTPDVQVVSGAALFDGSHSEAVWQAWGHGLRGVAVPRVEADAALLAIPEAGATEMAGTETACAIGALWADRALPDSRAAAGLAAVTASLTRDRRAERLRVMLLLGLAPAAKRPDARPALAGDLRRVIAELRQRVEADSVSMRDSPTVWAVAAAALALSSSGPDDLERVTELVRRTRRSLVGAGDDLWLETDPRTGVGAGSTSPSASLAIAAMAIGDRPLAFSLVRTIRRAASVNGVLERGAVSGEAELARTAITMLGSGRPASSAAITIDGTASRARITGGVATSRAPALGRRGTHRISVRLDRPGVALVHARTEYGLAWTAAPAERAPISLTLSGAIGNADGRAALVLDVRSRASRLLARPIVEIDLPAGAELDDEARQALARETVMLPSLSGRTLTLALHPLRPAGHVRIHLSVRWTIAGRLRGLGVSLWAHDRPRAVAILASRVIDVGEAREGGAR